jgi:hypothetical protein
MKNTKFTLAMFAFLIAIGTAITPKAAANPHLKSRRS